MIVKNLFRNGTGMLSVRIGRYSNGRVAVELMKHGERYAVASINLPEVPLDDDEIAVKNYSENDGALDTLIDACLVAPPHREVRSGWCMVPICRMLPTLQLLANERSFG